MIKHIPGVQIFFSLFLLLLPGMMQAQCTGGTAGAGITPTTAWQSAGTTNIAGNTYVTFNATAGFVYYFSFCSTDGGNSTFDTQITILTNTGAFAGGYNDDLCGLQSYLAWTCPANGVYRVLVNKYPCAAQAAMGTMVYKYSTPLSCPTNLGAGTTAVASLPYSSGPGTTCGFGNDLTAGNVTACGSTSYLGGDDKVWRFTPAVTGTVTINLTSGGSWNGLMLYQGCPLLNQGGTCVAVSQGAAGNQSITACLTGGQTYYLILDVFPAPNCNPYSNLTISAPVPVGGCAMGTGVVNIASLPYVSNGRTTCGRVNDLTAANTITCGSNLYLTGEDEVFVFTPSTTGNITIGITSSGSYTGMMLYQGCPSSTSCSGAAGVCVAVEQSSTGTKSMCANVTAGQTYYLVIDSWATPTCNPYNISISAPATLLAGANCSNAVAIGTLPYSATNQNTACHGNDYTNSSAGSCNTTFESGEDKVYSYTASGPECIGITLTGVSSNQIGYQVYSGCPGTAGATCLANNGGANSGTLNGSVTFPGAGVYYIIVDSWAPPANVSYNLTISSFGSGAPNDLPCNATALPLGVFITASNNCSGSSGEPAPPTCWLGSNVRNTVWFSVQAPASGQLRVRVIPNTLTNPQVAVYGGVCGAALVQYSCNDDALACGTTLNYSSEVVVNGLVPGATYYIVVDGYATFTGDFGLIAIDGSQPLPPLSNGQDCGNYLPVCDTTMSFGDPGFQSFGNVCDFPGSGGNCLLSGERGSVWFLIPINATGDLEFTVVPKDWAGAPSTVSTDYDFALWKVGGSGAVTCAQIAAGIVPVRCNYSALGVTGLYSATAGIAPPAYPGFGTAFEARLPVVTGESYALVISNFSNSTSGFDIMFGLTSPIAYGGTASSATWSGGIDTDWFKKENWGGCPIPSCTRDAIINGGIVLQPAINAAGAAAKSVLINPGASLTLNAGFTLNVCEHFTNFGTFNANPTSTVLFGGTSTLNQDINGTITGSNCFGTLTVSKFAGTVRTLQNIDVRKDFLIANASSVFNANGKYHKVTGNFTNNGVYTPGGGTLEFNGSAPQTYFSLAGVPGTLNNVVMNHTGSGVTLQSNMLIGPSGTLTLNQGKIITTPAYEVAVANRATGAVSSGNNNSFVQGFLRRYLNALGAYGFPVGHSTKGYQNAIIDFAYPAAPTIIDNLRGSFSTYGALPPPLGSVDCGGITFSSNPLDNGFWSFAASNNSSSGNFDLVLNNNNYTNAATSWTIMQNNGGGWSLGSGSCVASPLTAVRRTGMNGFMDFATAQGPSSLPVELISLSAVPSGNSIEVKWSTASEKENLGFYLERATSPSQFEDITWMDGAGNSTGILNYHYPDNSVHAEEIYYYRLRQVDFNGDATHSYIVSASLDRERDVNISVYPNPLTNTSRIQYEVFSDNSVVKITVLNAVGAIAEVIEDNRSATKGQYDLLIQRSRTQLSPGLYTLRFDLNGHSSFYKLIVPGR